MKLTTKIPLIILAVVIISVSSISYFSFTSSQSSLEKSIGENQLVIAKNLMVNIDRVLYGAYQNIRLIAEDEEFEEILPGYGDIKKSQEKLDTLLFLTGPWDELEIFNTQGEVIVANDDEDIGTNIDQHGSIDQKAFEFVIKNRSPYFSDLVLSEDTGKPTIIFAAPVFDESVPGKPVVGVVIGNFAWQIVIEILEELDNADVMLLNKNGIAIAEGREHHRNIREELISGKKIAFDIDIEKGDHYRIYERGIDIDEEVLSAVAKQKGYLGYKGSGWTLVLDTETKGAFKPVQDLLLSNSIITIIIIFLTSIITFFLIKIIINPIIKLKDSAQKISRGQLGERIEVKKGDEIGDLAEAFDNMRYSLKMVIEEYERKLGGKEVQLQQPKKIRAEPKPKKMKQNIKTGKKK